MNLPGLGNLEAGCLALCLGLSHNHFPSHGFRQPIHGQESRILGHAVAEIADGLIGQIGLVGQLAPRPFVLLVGFLKHFVDDLVQITEVLPVARREVGERLVLHLAIDHNANDSQLDLRPAVLGDSRRHTGVLVRDGVQHKRCHFIKVDLVVKPIETNFQYKFWTDL